MKFFISLALLSIMGFSGYVLAQTNKREDVHKKIADLRSNLNKAEEEFLSPTPEDLAKYAEFLKQPNTGLIRILPRETYDKPSELTIRGGGSYYSFSKLTHEYTNGSDIELQQNNFSVGFAGACYGFIAKLDDISLLDITTDNTVASVMASYEPATVLSKARIEQHRVNEGFEINGIRFRNQVDAVVGNTYLLRSVYYDTSDLLVCFQVVRQDTDGSMILTWKLLKKFDTPKLIRDSEN